MNDVPRISAENSTALVRDQFHTKIVAYAPRCSCPVGKTRESEGLEDTVRALQAMPRSILSTPNTGCAFTIKALRNFPNHLCMHPVTLQRTNVLSRNFVRVKGHLGLLRFAPFRVDTIISTGHCFILQRKHSRMTIAVRSPRKRFGGSRPDARFYARLYGPYARDKEAHCRI